MSSDEFYLCVSCHFGLASPIDEQSLAKQLSWACYQKKIVLFFCSLILNFHVILFILVTNRVSIMYQKGIGGQVSAKRLI